MVDRGAAFPVSFPGPANNAKPSISPSMKVRCKCKFKFHVQFRQRVHYYIRCVITTVHVVPMLYHVLVSRLADVAWFFFLSNYRLCGECTCWAFGLETRAPVVASTPLFRGFDIWIHDLNPLLKAQNYISRVQVPPMRAAGSSFGSKSVLLF